MTNLAGIPPTPKPEKIKPDPAYLARVRGEPCAGCRRPPPSEAHHCRDRPPHMERGLYTRLPGVGRKSGDRDAIPLCPECHRMFHTERARFHDLYGPDYGYIGPTRATLAEGEIEF